MSLENYKLDFYTKEFQIVYKPIRFYYNKTEGTSSISILLKLPTMIIEKLITIPLPFTENEPALKYKKPPYVFRDNKSVYENQRTHDLIQKNGPCRSMPSETRYAFQCEYDEWIYLANFEERTGFIVWNAIKKYVKNMEETEKIEEID